MTAEDYNILRSYLCHPVSVTSDGLHSWSFLHNHLQNQNCPLRSRKRLRKGILTSLATCNSRFTMLSKLLRYMQLGCSNASKDTSWKTLTSCMDFTSKTQHTRYWTYAPTMIHQKLNPMLGTTLIWMFRRAHTCLWIDAKTTECKTKNKGHQWFQLHGIHGSSWIAGTIFWL